VHSAVELAHQLGRLQAVPAYPASTDKGQAEKVHAPDCDKQPTF
jgi:hypothetical protein